MHDAYVQIPRRGAINLIYNLRGPDTTCNQKKNNKKKEPRLNPSLKIPHMPCYAMVLKSFDLSFPMVRSSVRNSLSRNAENAACASEKKKGRVVFCLLPLSLSVYTKIFSMP